MSAPIDIASIARGLSYVTELQYPRSRWCDGWRTIAGRKQKCGQQARWHFEQSKYKPKKGRAKSGNYCNYHLLTDGLRYSKYEEARAERAFKDVDVRNRRNEEGVADSTDTIPPSSYA